MELTAIAGNSGVSWEDVEAHGHELYGYCYRMLGSPFDADDAVQETMLRAWRASGRFAGRSSLRVWLHRIATNVCLDMLRQRSRRERPIDLIPAGIAGSPLGEPGSSVSWVLPAPDRRLVPERADPADVAVLRDTVRLAFIAALQHLSPRERAVLILCDVLRWQAREAAILLEITVASANGFLRRARKRMSGIHMDDLPGSMLTAEQLDLLSRYAGAMQRNDIDSLISLLHADATLSMPPYTLWLSGRDQIEQWFRRTPNPCRDAIAVPVHANGSPAFAIYHATHPGEPHRAFGIELLVIRGSRIAEIDIYLEPDLFPVFNLPTQLDAATRQPAGQTPIFPDQAPIVRSVAASGKRAVRVDR